MRIHSKLSAVLIIAAMVQPVWAQVDDTFGLAPKSSSREPKGSLDILK